LCQPAKQNAKPKDRISKQKTSFTAENIAKFTVQRLKSGSGAKIAAKPSAMLGDEHIEDLSETYAVASHDILPSSSRSLPMRP